MRSFQSLALYAVVAIGLIVLGCGPKPGTPEYVLEQLKKGEAVGGKGLVLLKKEHLKPMLAIVDDPKAPMVAKMQLMERVVRFEFDNPLEVLKPYLYHADSEVRFLVINRLEDIHTAEVGLLLAEKMIEEKEEIISLNMAGALQRLSSKLSEEDVKPVAELIIEALQSDKQKHKSHLLIALGGMYHPQTQTTLVQFLKGDSPNLANAASQGLLAFAAAHVDEMGDTVMAMLSHKGQRIRRNGLKLLYEHLRGGKEHQCKLELTEKLLQNHPQVPGKIEELLGGQALTKAEAQVAKDVQECLQEATANSSDTSAKPAV